MKKREGNHCCMDPIRPSWQEENEKRGLFREHIVHLPCKSYYTGVAPEKNKGFWLKLYNLSLMVGFTWPDSKHLQLWTSDICYGIFFLFLLRLWLPTWVFRMHVSHVATAQSKLYMQCAWWMHFNLVGTWCSWCHFEEENEKQTLSWKVLSPKGELANIPFLPLTGRGPESQKSSLHSKLIPGVSMEKERQANTHPPGNSKEQKCDLVFV